MTKAALCMSCSDLVSPYHNWQADRRWRWCDCQHTATRWRDGERGLLEVTSFHGPDLVRVLGLNNLFLSAGVGGRTFDGRPFDGSLWRDLHERSCREVSPHYLFSVENRNCWAVIVKAGESGDVFFVPYDDVVDMG